MLPVTTDENILYRYIDVIDALILSGGADVNPLLFNEEPHPNLGSVDADRDAMEIALVKLAAAGKMPILAICRGVQVLNVAFEGTLHQHLSPDEFGVQHTQKTSGDFASHTILIEPGSRLAAICGTETVVNSFHHQAVKDVAEGFVAAAKAKDGVIEAIELALKEPFTIGVQWHPEIMTEKHPVMLSLFKEFVKAAKEVAR
jgi:putative glutamine amidotransferase